MQAAWRNSGICKNNLFSIEELKSIGFLNLSFIAIALSTDDLIGIVSYILLHTFVFFFTIIFRDLVLTIPAHLVLVDAFCPFDLSITSLGYSFGIIETATLWICNYAKQLNSQSSSVVLESAKPNTIVWICILIMWICFCVYSSLFVVYHQCNTM